MYPMELDTATFRRLLEQRVACFPSIKCNVELTTREWIMTDKVTNILCYFEAVITINYITRRYSSLTVSEGCFRTDYQYFARGNVSKVLASDMILALNEKFDYLDNEESYYLTTPIDPRYKLRTVHKQSTISISKRRLGELLNPQTISESTMK